MKLPSLVLATLLACASAAQAGVLSYQATFSPEGGGGRTGSGFAAITFDEDSHVLAYKGFFSGLSGLTTASHFHCCTTVPGTGAAGVAVDTPSLAGFPLGVQSGSFDDSLDLDLVGSFNPAFITANGGTVDSARAAFLAGVDSGRVYMNIHSTAFGGGEIRGFLEVPEPGVLALTLAGLLAAGAISRRRTLTP